MIVFVNELTVFTVNIANIRNKCQKKNKYEISLYKRMEL